MEKLVREAYRAILKTEAKILSHRQHKGHHVFVVQRADGKTRELRTAGSPSTGVDTALRNFMDDTRRFIRGRI